jgi:hypothetical protein
MALEFNPFLRGTDGIILGLFTNFSNTATTAGSIFSASSSAALRVFPNTVAFPSQPLEHAINAFPGGHMAQFTNLTFVRSGPSIILGAVTNTTTTVLSSGTVGWFSLSMPGTSETLLREVVLISDSIGASGSNSIVVLNSTTFNTNDTMTLNAFSLRLV